MYIASIKSDWKINTTENKTFSYRDEIIGNQDNYTTYRPTFNFSVSDRSYKYQKKSHGSSDQQEMIVEKVKHPQ